MSYAIIENDAVVGSETTIPTSGTFVHFDPDVITGGQLKLVDGVIVAETDAEKSASDQALTDKINAGEVRSWRNHLLAETDWTAAADSPTQSSAMATYRTALRDITAQSDFPDNITWPTKP
tara:strand:+ start:4865 stop:5227 length:363 start_codon:yes stop_codon:yes gene_type:complete